MSETFRVILRCTCGYPLVVDTGKAVRATFGELKIYKDTGKVVASCRRCPLYHVLEAGKETGQSQQAAIIFTAMLDKTEQPVL